MRTALVLLRRVNLRHAFGQPVRTLLTVAGVATGVALLFSTSAIDGTLRASIRASEENLAGVAQLEVAAPDQTGLPATTLETVARTPGVAHAVPVERAISRLTGPDGDPRTLVLGLTADVVDLFPGASQRTALTTLGIFLSSQGVFLTRSLAAELGVSLGDEIRAETPRGDEPVSVQAIGDRHGRDVTVETPGGRLTVRPPETGRGSILDLNGGRLAVVSLPVAQALFGKYGRLDSIYAVLAPGTPIGSAERALRARLHGAAVVGPPGERARAPEHTFQAVATLTSLAATVALFVGLLVVYNALSMSLAERRRELSMELTLGASRAQLVGAVLIEAAVLGALAAATGIAVGYGLARALLAHVVAADPLLPITASGPLEVSTGDVAAAALGGIAVAVLGALVPALRISRAQPVDALRPEASYEWSRTRESPRRARWTVALGVAGIGLGVALLAVGARATTAGWPRNVALVLILMAATLLFPRVVPFAIRASKPPLQRAFGSHGRLAADALLAEPGRTALTAGALALAAALVIAVGSALSSFESQVKRDADLWNGAPLFVSASSYAGLTSDQPLPLSLGRSLERVRGVRFVYPWRYTLLNYGREQAVVYALPVARAARQGATTMLSSVGGNQRELISRLGAGEVAISRYAAHRHGLKVGDRIALPTPSGRHSFRIGMLFDDLASFDSIFMEYSVYARYWHDDKADRFGVLLDPGSSPQAVAPRLERAIRARGVSADVKTKQQLIDEILATLQSLFSLGRALQLAAVIAAALIVVNTMFTSVLERRWQFGLQQAIGMSRRDLAWTVLLEAASIGLVGGACAAVIGSALGYAMTRALEVQFQWRIDFQPPVGLVGATLVGAILVASLAALYPSRLTARRPIVEALRFE